MSASQLGEWGIIRLFRDIAVKSNVGEDDVSTVSLGGGRLAVLKVDMLVDKTDVPPGMSFRQIGMKALTMSVSDFAVKGVKPAAALIALGVQPRLKKRELKNIALGLRDASEKYGVPILGGDTNESSDLIIASILFGACEKEKIILRRGAKPGDLVVTSGKFGLVSAGLRFLLKNQNASATIKRKILNSVYQPEVKIDFGLKLRQLGATSSIDTSDGLALSLHQLSKASNVGFIIRKMPIATEARIFAEANRLDPFELTFYGGEEYEIVATLDSKRYSRAAGKLKEDVTVIGEVIEDKTITYLEGKSERKIEAKGWEHFKPSTHY